MKNRNIFLILAVILIFSCKPKQKPFYVYQVTDEGILLIDSLVTQEKAHEYAANRYLRLKKETGCKHKFIIIQQREE